MAIPTYEQWLEDTAVFGRSRSDYLKLVDEAIKTYNMSPSDGTRGAIKSAFNRWRFDQSRQGKKWMENARNSKGALTGLHRSLNELDKRNLTQEELDAMKFIAHAQAMALQHQFMGKEVQFKSSTLLGLTNRAGEGWQKFKASAGAIKESGSKLKDIHDNASALKKGVESISSIGMAATKAAAHQAARFDMSDTFGTIKSQITGFCRVLCPDLDPNKVFSALKLGSIESFATDLAPVIGALSSGGKAIAGWVGVVQKAWTACKIADTRFAIMPGDPEAAFDAVLTLLDREIASATAKATTTTVAFTGKTLGAFLDGGAATGPAVGLMEILADIFQTIFEYVRDYRECSAANEMLRLGELNLELFNVCPVLGCYFLVIQDHSTIINFVVADYGTENWMFDVERLIRKIEPLLNKSGEFIRASRLEIPNMSRAKGIVEKNYRVKTGFAKVTGLPDHIKSEIMEKIDSVFEKHEKPPKVDKSRIYGMWMGPDGVLYRKA